MNATKLWRIELPVWSPPLLRFLIERHGATVNGSSRAHVYTWEINPVLGTASCIEVKTRQLGKMDSRLDVRSLAASVADAIASGVEDPRLMLRKDGSVFVKIGVVIPETNKQTTASRRKRFRAALQEVIGARGWVEIRSNSWRKVRPQDHAGQMENRPAGDDVTP